MLKKLMIRTWRGPLPTWTPKFLSSLVHFSQSGWDFVLLPHWESIRRRALTSLQIHIPQEIDTRKPGDYDPANGVLFSDLIQGYDFWGHFNLDCVYGNLSHWLPDTFLNNIDIYGNDPGAVCGPFTLYRNCPKVNNLFQQSSTWHADFTTPKFLGWDEIEFTQVVNRAALSGQINFASGFLQAHDHMTEAHQNLANSSNPPVHRTPGGDLIDNVTHQEIMMYHFNQTRRWPLG